MVLLYLSMYVPRPPWTRDKALARGPRIYNQCEFVLLFMRPLVGSKALACLRSTVQIYSITTFGTATGGCTMYHVCRWTLHMVLVSPCPVAAGWMRCREGLTCHPSCSIGLWVPQPGAVRALIRYGVPYHIPHTNIPYTAPTKYFPLSDVAVAFSPPRRDP